MDKIENVAFNSLCLWDRLTDGSDLGDKIIIHLGSRTDTRDYIIKLSIRLDEAEADFDWGNSQIGYLDLINNIIDYLFEFFVTHADVPKPTEIIQYCANKYMKEWD